MVYSLRHLFANTHILPKRSDIAYCSVMPNHDLTSTMTYTTGSAKATISSPASIKRKISKLSKNEDIKTVIFVGKDPLYRSDLSELLRHAKEKCKLRTGIATDGLLFDKELLKTCMPYLDTLYIPLDADNESVNSLLRPAHQFSRAVATLQDLAKEDIMLDVSTLVTSMNHEAVFGISRLLDGVANVWRLYRCLSYDTGGSKLPGCFISPSEFQTLIEAIYVRMKYSATDIQIYQEEFFEKNVQQKFAVSEC